MFRSIWIWIVLLIAHFQVKAQIACTHVGDSLILVELYQNTNGPAWTRTWDLNSPVSTWFGISLNGNGCVSGIELNNNRLTGTLPESICDLGGLQILTLSNNKLTGNLPQFLDRLKSLEVLVLVGNHLNGYIPPTIGLLPSLVTLDLSKNDFEGELPLELGYLPMLTSLKISECIYLWGGLPEEIGNLKYLEVLMITKNNITGIIPENFKKLESLKRLDLSDNHLSDTLSAEFGKLNKLEYLYLDFNQLTGSIPATFGQLSELVHFSASHNNLNGTIPTELVQAKAITNLNLGNNNLSGSIPPLSNSLYQLSLKYNQLTGTIPESIFTRGSLAALDLSHNQLTGNLPLGIKYSPNLFHLDVSYNQLSGPLPYTMSELRNLSYLGLCPNNISAPIPDLKANRRLDLSGVDFSCIMGRTISGHVFADPNINCNALGGRPLIDKRVTLDTNYFTFTDAQGYYSFFVNDGDHVLEMPDSLYLYQLACPASGRHEFNISAANTRLDTFDFGQRTVKDCALLSVKAVLSRMRLCEINNVTIRVRNEGNATAQSVFATIKIPDFIHNVLVNRPFVNNFGGEYRVQLGDIGPGQENQFLLSFKIPCDSMILGQKLCIPIYVTPDHNCSPVIAGSDHDIYIQSFCQMDSVRFRIFNHGSTPIFSAYEIFKNFLRTDSVPIILAANSYQDILTENNAQQISISVDDLTGDQIIEDWEGIENCTGNEFSSYADIFSGVSKPTQTMICGIIRGSFDPNEKYAVPISKAEIASVLRNQQLQYIIRFQNTGNDTAYRVRVTDVIDTSVLDIKTVQLGLSSHPFKLQVEGNTMNFVFEPIALVDSKTDETNSHGFVQFFIQQKKDLHVNTLIHNRAGIYFDSNPAVITNVVSLLVINPEKKTTGTKDIYLPSVISVYPNPSTGLIKLSYENDFVPFRIVDSYGQLILSQNSPVNEIFIAQPGIYFIQSQGVTAKFVITK